MGREVVLDPLLQRGVEVISSFVMKWFMKDVFQEPKRLGFHGKPIKEGPGPKWGTDVVSAAMSHEEA